MGKTFQVDESCVYGRTSDKESIVEKLLLSSSSIEEGNRLEIISIVGTGGTGKTLLTKLVYSDKRVQDRFDIKAWVCAAAKFHIFKVAKDILEEITSTPCDSCDNDDHQVLLQVKENLKGKRFLIILDDVWDDNGSDWSLLMEHLDSGLHGNRIIVTTRNQSVASAFGGVTSNCYFHFLSGLSDEDCWSLFAKHAFNGDDYTNPNHPRLAILGKEIVRKCKGLPLIAIMLGDFLCSVKDDEEWEKILNHMEFRSNYNVFMILKLSHVDLLFHLRQCLAYGLKSSEDYDFVKRELILSWIQEGLVRPSKEEIKRKHNESRDFIIHDLAMSPSQNSFQSSFMERDSEVIFEKGMTITSLVLEILLMTMDQISTPKRPHYALIGAVASLAALCICITELVHKGQKHNIRWRRTGIGCWLHPPSSNEKYPFTILDVFSLITSISQLILTCISYSYVLRGVSNPIKVCFVPVTYTICMAFSKLLGKPSQTNSPARSNT